MSDRPDAVVVGAGPNGLAAAVELVSNGLDVLLLEAEETVGGAARTEELTLPGFRHDVGSAVYPLGVGSPFFASLPLGDHGLEWIHSDMLLAHPLDDGRAAFLRGGLERVGEDLGADEGTYRRMVKPFLTTTLLALTHRQVADIAGDRLPDAYRDRLARWRYGPGAFKVDWALDGPIPWTRPEVADAGTVHLGWAYCHVPAGWDGDATGRIEAQVERFAPGFRERILARSTHGPRELEAWNANLVGGDVNGASLTLAQTLGALRQALHPWSTPLDGLYVCSASRPPGGGVHGMAGYCAAREALGRSFGIG